MNKTTSISHGTPKAPIPASREGFILIVVLSLVVIVGIMAGVFLSTARQSMRTVRQWENYDNALWASQSALDAQRHLLDGYFDTISTGTVVNLASLDTLKTEVESGRFNVVTQRLDSAIGNATNFPYRDAIVSVTLTCTNAVDVSNEYLVVLLDATAVYGGVTRRFGETVRFQTDRSIFRYAYFEDDTTLFYNSKNMVINGDLWASDGIQFKNPTDDLVINGDLYSAGLIMVGTQYVHTAYQPDFYESAKYVNESYNSGLSIAPSVMCSFARPYVVPDANGFWKSSYRTNSESFAYKDRYVMPHIDISRLRTNVTGVLINGGFPCSERNGSSESFNGSTPAPFPLMPGSLNVNTHGSVGYCSSWGGAYQGRWNPYRYWLDEVLVKAVTNVYGGTRTNILYKPIDPTFSSLVTNAKGPESIYLQITSGIDTNLQDRGCLHVTGSLYEPFKINGNIVVEGDLYIEGYYTGQGSIYAGRNIYILDDLLATNPPVWTYLAAGQDYSVFTNEMANNLTKDFLGLFAAGNIWVIDDSDVSGSTSQEFGIKTMQFASNPVPYRTTATSIFRVSYINGEPWFTDSYLTTNGTRVKSGALPTNNAPITAPEYANLLTRAMLKDPVKSWMQTQYAPLTGSSLTNGEPRTYLDPCISSNAFFAYTRSCSASWDKPYLWRWRRKNAEQIDALLYTEHYLSGGVVLRVNGGLYFRRSGFKEIDVTARNYWNFGLFGYNGNVFPSFNWDCRLGEPEFNQYLPLEGLDSYIINWVELMPEP